MKIELYNGPVVSVEEAHDIGRGLDPRFVTDFYGLLRARHTIQYKIESIHNRAAATCRQYAKQSNFDRDVTLRRWNRMCRQVHEALYELERMFADGVDKLLMRYSDQLVVRVLLFLRAFGIVTVALL